MLIACWLRPIRARRREGGPFADEKERRVKSKLRGRACGQERAGREGNRALSHQALQLVLVYGAHWSRFGQRYGARSSFGPEVGTGSYEGKRIARPQVGGGEPGVCAVIRFDLVHGGGWEWLGWAGWRARAELAALLLRSRLRWSAVTDTQACLGWLTRSINQAEGEGLPLCARAWAWAAKVRGRGVSWPRQQT